MPSSLVATQPRAFILSPYPFPFFLFFSCYLPLLCHLWVELKQHSEVSKKWHSHKWLHLPTTSHFAQKCIFTTTRAVFKVVLMSLNLIVRAVKFGRKVMNLITFFSSISAQDKFWLKARYQHQRTWHRNEATKYILPTKYNAGIFVKKGRE